MNTLRSILEDNAGGFSSIRLLMLVWATVLITTWVVVAIYTRTIPDIPPGVLAFTGMVVGGKVVQRYGEKLEQPS